MRIIQVLSAASTRGVADNRVWLRNLHEPLLDLGHEVVLIGADEGYAAARADDAERRARFSEHIVEVTRDAVSRGGVDLFFSYLTDGTIDTGAIREIRSMGIPTCNFSCNNTHQFDLVDEISPAFDFNAHSEKDAVAKFESIGANAVWFPMAANPTFYHPVDTPRTLDVCFVGQRYAMRPMHIGMLLDNGIDVHAYGPGWRLSNEGLVAAGKRRLRRLATALRAKTAIGSARDRAVAEHEWLREAERVRVRYDRNMHGPVSDEEMVRLYTASSVSLGFLEVFDAHDPSAEVKQHLHLRDFEAPMCGALYLTGYIPELEEFFEPEREVLTYRDEAELLEKTRFYLTNEAAAQAVRDAGLARAHACHTYQKRFTDLFRAIGVGG
ncbi:MAG: hypothetical protein CVT60_05035 [Actinobacteria bacterium HGW-Actinobacteria-10]|jgi:spore maturation protein CgeB|nr:MAG: hypothetical protein CVT60_05035 [Actinobacteria bacterium HGW-Actinobacteria-10]